MECNREEAVRAREVAEKKLELKEYKMAKKLCLKAQTLFPNLENLTQLITVCSVHCSAIDKINGETDWYGVLQVGTNADDLAIKKQYRKLALLLHPDKNKFPGAESAFKLIGEANGILTDKGKRSLHDMKRTSRINNNNAQNRRPPQAARAGQTGQTGQPSQTFWTICTTCGMRYQYFMSIYKKALRCQNCLQAFVAYDINEQTVPAQNPNRNQNPNLNHMFNRANGSATAPSPFQRPSPVFNFQTGTGTTDYTKFEKVNLEKAAKPAPAGTSFAKNPPQNKRTKPQNKRRKRVVEEDEEEESEADSSESEEEIVLEKNVKMNGSSDPPRRSSRRKNDVKYNEKDIIDDELEDDLDDDVSDDAEEEDDDVTVMYSRKRLRKGSDKEKSAPNKKEKETEKEKEKDIKTNHKGKEKESEKEKDKEIKTNEKTKRSEKGKEKETETSEEEIEIESDSDPDPGPKEFVYEETEFFDFDQIRSKTRFAVDQVWAAYDDLDGMPRFYARITSLLPSPTLHVRFSWLEPDPLRPDPARSARSGAALPVACGNFILGESQVADELLMFSHEVEFCERPKGKGRKRGNFEIFPKRGEIWAVFKNWDGTDVKARERFEYEIVEVLSDLGDSTGFVVTRLARVKGFVSVFTRGEETAPFVVPVTEIFRFSHRVPSYRIEGEERESVPVGAVELDPASLPKDLDKAFGAVELDVKGGLKEELFSGKSENRGEKGKMDGNLNNGESKEKLNGKFNNGKLKEKVSGNVVGKSDGNSKEKSNGNMNNGKSEEKQNENKDSKSKEKLDKHKPDIKSKEKPNENPEPSEKSAENSNSNSNSVSLSEEKSNSESDTESRGYYSEPEFYVFAIDRAIQKFQPGQIWALYSDVDQFPKYYGWVKRVDPPHEELHIRWLEPVSDGLTGETKRWVDQSLPIGCGLFEIKGESISFNCNAFSHLVRASVCTGTKKRYEILPCRDEIWALYRNWSVGWGMDKIKDSCQYDLVKVGEINEKGIKVEILSKVDGHNAVFTRDRSKKMMLVPKGEYVRFSHMVPSHRLEKEKNGELKGCFELDSASVPEHLL